MNLFPLVQRLQDMEVGVMGKSLFINMIPADAPQGVLLRTSLSGTRINYELPGFYRASFKIIARSGGYEVGEALITKAIEALTLGHGEQVGGYVYRYCRPVAHPAAYPLSKGNLIEFSTDFDVAFHVYKEPEPEPEPVEPEPVEPDDQSTETEGETDDAANPDPNEDPSAEPDASGETSEDESADGQGDAADPAPEPESDDEPVDTEPVEPEPVEPEPEPVTEPGDGA